MTATIKITRLYLILYLAVALSSCTGQQKGEQGTWARGADLSWLSEMEHDGMTFYPPHIAKDDDCMRVLADMGMNAVRLRVWVNHTTGWSNIPDMVKLAQRAAGNGQRLMIDIHYSDFFADPNHQNIPEAWQDYDYPAMVQAVRQHTIDVLHTLQSAGVKPEWVQIGNETPNGMLWPMGQLSATDDPQGARGTPDEWDRYAGFTAAGYEAAKEVYPDITVIVHVDNAYERRDWFWQALHEHGGKWDMIGLSHYPMMSAWNGGKSWQEMNEMAEANIRQLTETWQCPVMVAEIGMFAGDPLSATVMDDFVRRAEAIEGCAGIFYWEPEVYGGWRPAEYIPLGWGSYNMGAFTDDGEPSEVLKILLSSEHKKK